MQNLLCILSILYLHDCVKYTFNIGLNQDTCKQICFKLGKLLALTELYSLFPVRVTLTTTQGCMVTGMLELM